MVIKKPSIERRCYRTGKYPVCRRVRASFSPDILPAAAVEGSIAPLFLTVYSRATFQRVEVYHESEDSRLKGTVQIYNLGPLFLGQCEPVWPSGKALGW